MSLQSAYHAALATKKGPECSVAKIIAALSDDDAAFLAGLLNDSRNPGSRIASALKAIGHDVQAQTLNRHRRGECGCRNGAE